MISPPAGTVPVFVYGTLKRGGTNHAFIADQVFLGESRTQPGYRLYVVADYPGMVKDQSDQRGVSGEVWAVDPSTLGKLDDLEGVAEKLYRRDSVRFSAPFAELGVQTYLYLRNIRGRRLLVDGNWPVRTQV